MDDDPVAAPLNLAILRYCMRADSAAEEKVANIDFAISYKAGAGIHELSDDEDDVPPAMLLTRATVILAREMIARVKKRNIMVLDFNEVSEVIAQSKAEDAQHMAVRFIQAMRELASHVRSDGHQTHNYDIDDLLHFLCPQSLPKHMRMYHEWLKECDDFLADEGTVNFAEKARTVFCEEEQKPFLSSPDARQVEQEFQRLDRLQLGYLTGEDLMWGWGFACEGAEYAVRQYGGERGVIKRQDFLRMMCPSENRMPQMRGDARRMFGELITWEAMEQRRKYEDKENHVYGRAA